MYLFELLKDLMNIEQKIYNIMLISTSFIEYRNKSMQKAVETQD